MQVSKGRSPTAARPWVTPTDHLQRGMCVHPRSIQDSNEGYDPCRKTGGYHPGIPPTGHRHPPEGQGSLLPPVTLFPNQASPKCSQSWGTQKVLSPFPHKRHQELALSSRVKGREHES